MAKRKPWLMGIVGILVAALLLGSVFSNAAAQVSAASTSEIRSQISALEAQSSSIQAKIDELEAQMADNYADMEEAVAQKLLLDQQIFLLHDQIGNINEQISSYSVLIADKQDELDDAEELLEELKEQYKGRIRAMEEDGTVSYWSVLFKSKSFTDFLDRLNMIEEIAASDQRRLEELQAATDAVEAARAALEEEKAGLEVKQAELNASQEELNRKQEEADELLNQLRARGEEFQKYLEEAELEQSAVMQQLAQKNDELADLEYQQWLATYVPPSTTQPQPGDTTGGSADTGTDTGTSGGSGWLIPVSGYYISSPFGMRMHPMLGYERMHEGIDMVCAEGTPIYASRSGVVTTASYNDSCGNYVYIGHGDGYGSVYMHMSYYVVSYGEYVSQGQIIGYVGDTGLAEVAHLHFGISYNGAYVNPMNYI